MQEVNREKLHRLGALTFTNEYAPDQVMTEVEIHYGQISTWDNPYKIFVDGELKHTYKTFASAQKKMNELISYHKLERAE